MTSEEWRIFWGLGVSLADVRERYHISDTTDFYNMRR